MSPPAESLAEGAAVGGALGPDPEDFHVEELPLYAPSGAGEHRYVRLEKRGWTTPDALQAVARAAGTHPRELGSAGMKDRHAVTVQWVSLPARARPVSEWTLPEGLRVLEETLHGNKLRTGHLAGNRFLLTLRDVPEGGAARAQARLAAFLREGVPNRYGEQRFGRDGDNLSRALEWLARGAPPVGARTRLWRKLMPSVVQSAVFNEYLDQRRALGTDRLLQGEVVRREGSRGCFVVRSPAEELPRLAAREMHLTGPLPGPKLLPAEAEARDLEQGVLATLGLDERVLGALGRLVDGTRRDLLVFPLAPTLEDLGHGVLRLGFVLPPGAYATVVLAALGVQGRHPRENRTEAAGVEEP